MSYDPSKDDAMNVKGSDPSARFEAVTPNDNADLAAYPRGISVNVSGIVAMVPSTQEGVQTPVQVYISAGVIFPVSPRRVMATNTTATGIVAYF